ncbi:hypothetical protein BVY03_01555 [bacterium K02(2017)]|nr:hypothetical protein BVY03_01555 [bacterium K02(2017)]
MTISGEEDDFEWEEGKVLDDDIVASVPEVRAKGLPKLNKAVHADPVVRKKERDEKIIRTQSKPYRAKKTNIEPEDLLIEESQSGISADVEVSEVKRLLDKGKNFKGLDYFSDRKKKPEKDED